MLGDSCGPAAWNRAYVYFQIPGTVKLDPELHKKRYNLPPDITQTVGGKNEVGETLTFLQFMSMIRWMFCPEFFFLKKGKGYKEN